MCTTKSCAMSLSVDEASFHLVLVDHCKYDVCIVFITRKAAGLVSILIP